MRSIRKQPEPHELTEWRSRYNRDINFGYDLMRLDRTLTETVTQSLLREQGWLCAYTGRRIERDTCHIEHIIAQAHCRPGEDIDYGNLVVCYPAPNTGEAPYGAHQKKDWPSPAVRSLFVSPLVPRCDSRFFFNLRGEISTNQDDIAAKTTVSKLKLDHKTLTALRKEAIQHTLSNLPIDRARKRLAALEAKEQHTGMKLEPYCFALKHALRQHIKRLEYIRESKRKS